jgi:hypothetical protein
MVFLQSCGPAPAEAAVDAQQPEGGSAASAWQTAPPAAAVAAAAAAADGAAASTTTHPAAAARGAAGSSSTAAQASVAKVSEEDEAMQMAAADLRMAQLLVAVGKDLEMHTAAKATGGAEGSSSRRRGSRRGKLTAEDDAVASSSSSASSSYVQELRTEVRTRHTQKPFTPRMRWASLQSSYLEPTQEGTWNPPTGLVLSRTPSFQVCLAPLKLERHYFSSNSHDIAPRLANRLAKEFAGLAASLPLTVSSTAVPCAQRLHVFLPVELLGRKQSATTPFICIARS